MQNSMWNKAGLRDRKGAVDKTYLGRIPIEELFAEWGFLSKKGKEMALRLTGIPLVSGGRDKIAQMDRIYKQLQKKAENTQFYDFETGQKVAQPVSLATAP
jgi:hypothetical protein